MAKAEDEELAEAVVDQQEAMEKLGKKVPRHAPSLETFSPEVYEIAAAVDRLGEVIVTQIAAAGGKPPRVRPTPRPQSAFDRVKARRSWARHGDLVAEVEQAQERWQVARG